MSGAPVPPPAPEAAAPPRSLVIAALGAALEGLALFVGGVVALIVEGTPQVWGFVVLLGVGVAAAGVALARGARGARGPVVVVQLLGLGVAFYAGVTSERPEWGVPIAVVCLAILVGVLTRAGRDWAEQ
ncbi:hypothetical protein LQ327_29350 [Actinomycetospora endophytica]|uniref:Integral membrane protein n=1 Tax=Actinomycetospora endophytica TaxID=2291215 RepID=A0ABS8PGV1_9PSEU|nr:hypothetical protein [Actinomycetospora endophytica]MCD2197485.1 hypothetical protein [Actinomycetospora endophytica]